MHFLCFHFLGKIFTQLQLNAKNIFNIKKDAIYNFINSYTFGWRNFLLKISESILEYFESIAKKTRDAKRNKHKQLIAKTRPKFLCIDDTTLKKDRSKKLENFGRRLYDHSLQLYFKGYFIVVALFTDGVSQIPIDFALSATSNKNNVDTSFEKKSTISILMDSKEEKKQRNQR